MKIHIKILGIVGGLLLLPSITFAQLQITEIMFDIEGTDTGREWIELYNEGTTEIPLQEVTILENNVQHKLNTEDVSVLPASTYMVVTDNKEKFVIDNPSYTGLVVDSVFSLSNTGETINVYHNGISTHQVSYTSENGGTGDGNSLHWDGTSLQALLPTPGSALGTESASEEETATTQETSQNETTKKSSHNSTVAITHLPDIKLKTDAGRDRLVSVNSPVTFSGRIQANGKEIAQGRYSWSFGDGHDQQGKEVTHTFAFPGEYVVIVRASFEGVTAVSRTTIEVFEPEMVITQIDSTKGFVELHNKSAHEINLGEWILSGEQKTFTFPPDTIILASRTVKIPFSFKEGLTHVVALKYPTRETVVMYQNTSQENEQLMSIQQSLEQVSLEMKKLKV